jgi:hypothetical protein
MLGLAAGCMWFKRKGALMRDEIRGLGWLALIFTIFLCVLLCWPPMAALDAIVTVINKKFAELFDELW